MVRDKNNNDRLILGNMDFSRGTSSSSSSSSSKLCPVYPIEINHRIAFCPPLHTFKYMQKSSAKTVFKAC